MLYTKIYLSQFTIHKEKRQSLISQYQFHPLLSTPISISMAMASCTTKFSINNFNPTHLTKPSINNINGSFVKFAIKKVSLNLSSSQCISHIHPLVHKGVFSVDLHTNKIHKPLTVVSAKGYKMKTHKVSSFFDLLSVQECKNVFLNLIASWDFLLVVCLGFGEAVSSYRKWEDCEEESRETTFACKEE